MCLLLKLSFPFFFLLMNYIDGFRSSSLPELLLRVEVAESIGAEGLNVAIVVVVAQHSLSTQVSHSDRLVDALVDDELVGRRFGLC